MEPINDFYCNPQSEEEAREIVERAVAHGAELNERAGKFLYVGVLFGKTRFLSRDEVSLYYPHLEHLNIDQLRERAPFVKELTKDEQFCADAYPEYNVCVKHCGVSKERHYAARAAMHFAGMLEKPKPFKLSTTSHGAIIEPTKPNKVGDHGSVSTDTTFESLKKAFDIFNLVYDTNIADEQVGVFKYILDLVESVKREDSK